MPIKVFLLGRPGSGKSTAFHAIAKYLEQKRQDWSLVRIKDYAILYEMFLADNEGKKFCSIEHGGFEVLDFSVLDEASLKLEKHIKQNMSSTTNGKLVIIEFARSDYYKNHLNNSTAICYETPIFSLSKLTWKHVYSVYMSASLFQLRQIIIMSQIIFSEATIRKIILITSSPISKKIMK